MGFLIKGEATEKVQSFVEFQNDAIIWIYGRISHNNHKCLLDNKLSAIHKSRKPNS